MIVPVEFKDTSLQSAVEYLGSRSKQRRRQGAVNFVLNVPPELANKKVTLEMDHVPVTGSCGTSGELAGVSFQIEKYAIS